MAPEPTRRQLLLAGAGLALAACSKKTTTIDARSSTTAGGGKRDLSILLASFQPLAGDDTRVAFAVLDGDEPLKGVDKLAVTFSPADEPSRRVRATATIHRDGIEARPFFATRAPLDKATPWTITVEHDGRRGEAALNVFDPDKVKVPVPGEPMVSVATPTPADSRGVDPICTRDPVCPLHEVSLDEALKGDQPVVVLFSTPALCQSAVCGPVLDILLAEAEAYRDKVRILHVEIFTDLSGKKLAPAVQAFNLENEPFLFAADTGGVVRHRIDGPFDRSDAREILSALAAG
jgi:hypothetical protein